MDKVSVDDLCRNRSPILEGSFAGESRPAKPSNSEKMSQRSNVHTSMR